MSEHSLGPFESALVGGLLGFALAIVLYLSLSCAQPEPLAPARQGDTIDPCDACWMACGKATSQEEAIFCSQECSQLCAVLHQDGGT